MEKGNQKRQKKDRRREPNEQRKTKRKIGAKPRVMVADAWAAKGEAVISPQSSGKRTLIWAGIPDEKAVVQLTHRGQNQDYGHFVSTRKPSPFRRDAPCKRFDRCGGCSLMHLNLDGQEKAKLEMFRQEISKHEAKLSVPKHLVRAGQGEKYRFVSKLVAGRAAHGALRLGARNRDGAIVPIPDCLVNDPSLNILGKKIAHWIQELKIYPYTKQNPRGLRYIVIRKARASDSILVTLVATNKSFYLDRLAEMIINAHRSVKGVVLHLNNTIGNAIFERDEDGRVLSFRMEGQSRIKETIGEIEYEMSAGDFFQVNLDIAEKLQQDVIEASKQFSGYPMIDLYCGVGFFTLALAKEHGWALGIEGVASAIERAKSNAQLNTLRAEFRAGDVIDELEGVAKILGGASPCIVVDPARRGLEAGVIEQLLALKPAAIIYISCHPGTLIRDIKKIQKSNWVVQSLQLYDMFPQTVHVEAMAVLIPPKSTNLQKKSNPRRIVLSNIKE